MYFCNEFIDKVLYNPTDTLGQKHSGAKIPVVFSRDIFTNLMLYWGGCLICISAPFYYTPGLSGF